MMNNVINIYIASHFEEWRRYARMRCRRNGVSSMADDILGDALLVLLSKDEACILQMINQGCGEYTRLDLFLFTVVKWKALVRYSKSARIVPMDDLNRLNLVNMDAPCYELLDELAGIDFLLSEPTPQTRKRRMYEARLRRDHFTGF